MYYSITCLRVLSISELTAESKVPEVRHTVM